MRIIDWSSDVCSSDLINAVQLVSLAGACGDNGPEGRAVVVGTTRDIIRHSGEGYSNVIIIDNVQRIEGTWAGGQRSGSFTWIVITQTAQFKPGENGALEVDRSEEHTSELQSLMRISYAVFCLKKKK